MFRISLSVAAGAFAILIGGASARSQAPSMPDAPAKRLIIRAGRLIDGVSETARSDQGILVEDGRIVAVGPYAELAGRADGAEQLDLRGMTVLPGLIDNHTHVLLQGDITSRRLRRAAAQGDRSPIGPSARPWPRARRCMNGFTAIRDLETEGAMYADVDVKTAIARGDHSRARGCSSRRGPCSATGMYPLLGYSWELKMPEGVQIVDGPDEIRKAVREQVEVRRRLDQVLRGPAVLPRTDGRLRSWVNFTDEELKTLVTEAHRLGRKVAAHAMGWDGIDAALRAGREHHRARRRPRPRTSIDRMVEAGGVLVPDDLRRRLRGARAAAALAPKMVDLERQAFGKALKKGVQDRLRHRRRRLRLDREPGEGVRVHGALRHDPDAGDQVGDDGRGPAASTKKTAWARSSRATTPTSSRSRATRSTDITELERVKFVMKGGVVYRNDR